MFVSVTHRLLLLLPPFILILEILAPILYLIGNSNNDFINHRPYNLKTSQDYSLAIFSHAYYHIPTFDDVITSSMAAPSPSSSLPLSPTVLLSHPLFFSITLIWLPHQPKF